ncbi:YnaM/YnfT family protein [Acinetobacter baumannii]
MTTLLIASSVVFVILALFTISVINLWIGVSNNPD